MFEDARGRDQARLHDDPRVRHGVEQWMERVFGFYGEDGGVDVQVIDGQLALNAKTVKYLYSEFTPLSLHYVRGSRPMLEAVVNEVVRPNMGEREKALAIMRRVRDNQDHGLKRPGLFYGGDEEDLLKRGAVMCNEVSRLFVCLCQIAGLPARLHASHITGHMMSEVYAGGKWQWIDSMKGMAPVLDDDTPASTWDLIRDPKILDRQPRSFWDDVRPPQVTFGTTQRDPRNLAYQLASIRDCCFHPSEAQALGNYYVWEHGKYTFPWFIDPAEPERLAEARHKEALNRLALNWPVYYHNAHLFNETLKMRG